MVLEKVCSNHKEDEVLKMQEGKWVREMMKRKAFHNHAGGFLLPECDGSQLQDAGEGYPDGIMMERKRKEGSLIPSIVKSPWDVVKLGRCAGVFVLLSAPVLAVWETLSFLIFGDNPVQVTSPYFIIPFLTSLIDKGVWGVIIILLAEFVDRMTDHNEE
jgi:hypothetical protein